MIVSTHRPYFAPFPGFFQKAHLCDIFVILDNVQFPRGTTWITRNRFKNDQGTLWMTIPVWKKGLGLQSIDDVRICHESGK
ncbi:MAG: WbqC family protein, partial [Deltaproteobacteria bacterium]|nr:WbqC family protein [Deltaproteobacteria bacterium]